MDQQLHASLSALETRLTTLLTTLTNTPTAAPAPAAALALLEADASLTTAVATLRTHQQNYARILRLRAVALRLEDHVRGIVREMDRFESEIRTACEEEAESDSEKEADEDEDEDEAYESASEGGDNEQDVPRTTNARNTKSRTVDYRLLLNLARRISKYNHQAAADAQAGGTETRANGGDAEAEGMVEPGAGTAGTARTGFEEEETEPVASVTRSATRWLDESASLAREAFRLPYPAEERIRMGVMGQMAMAMAMAAAEGRPGGGFDLEQEVERLVREAEGLEAGEEMVRRRGEEERVEQRGFAVGAARAAVSAGVAGASAVAAAAAAPKPKPKPHLDLDLYDPEHDEL